MVTMKIGICTILYRNNNYGANLQAYALNKICNDYGALTETILYCNSSRFRATLSNIKQFLINFKKSQFNQRKRKIAIFRNDIPHSKVYYKDSISQANKKYDCFLVGSDQVWNPEYINKFYSLSFVEPNKIKVSYAASVGKNILTDKQKVYYKEILKDFDFVSVREANIVPILKGIAKQDVVVTLDPTLLLSADEWSILIKRKIIDDDYLFCYFLNDNTDQRKLAAQFAKQKGLKIVTLPYLSYSYRKCDDGFGDYCLYDVGPEDFISLIKFSKYIFTDSFHATVFSHIFEKQFIVFDDMKSSTGSRLETLTKMFHTEERFINSKINMSISYINSIPEVDYNQDLFKDYNLIKNESIYFLKKIIKDR